MPVNPQLSELKSWFKFRLKTTIILGSVILAACADGPVNEPAELKDIEPQFEVEREWREVIGNSDDGKFNSLVPALWDDKIVAAGLKGVVTAYDRKTGDLLWETDTKSDLSGGVTVNAGVVAVGSRNAEVFVLDAESGKLLWKAEVSSEILAPPAIDNGKLVVRTADGRVFALELSSGKQVWFYDRVLPKLTLRGTSAPVAIGGIVVSGFSNGKIATFNIETGDLLWEQRLSSPRGGSDISRIVDVDATPVIYGSSLYAAGYNGFAIALDLQNGRFLWREPVSVLRDPLVDSAKVYLVNTDGVVSALDRFSGDKLWENEDFKYRRVSAAADNGDTIIVGDVEGYLHWLDKNTGKEVARIHLDDYGVNKAPIVTPEMIYAVSRYGYLYAFKNPTFKAADEQPIDTESYSDTNSETE